ncbi:carbohydrate kinase family protein [Actinomadura sp. GC306]|uniref:carbohydrate kinase family protein n=1 Tax=Actinomadura sp. GC306 TaxID=2530367 RepID=UPI001048B725|nr:carbohydrate kinase family protein [Actinomadura sp. GC306]TDC66355.1 carbohydrate kinase family protein [Actinomadura sp. GC306]
MHVISRIGRDHYTDDIVRHLSRLVTSCHLPTSAGAANGRTIVLRDRNARRIIAADGSTPIRDLSVTDIEEARGTIAGSDAVFADGYLLLAEPSRTAVTAAMKIANEHGTVFWLDLVPHDMDRYLDLDTIEPLLRRADIIVSQARTMAALLGLPDRYPYRESGFPDLLAALAKLSGTCTWYLRHGDHDISKVLVSRAGRRIRAYGTGFVEEKSMAGFGDRVTAAEMHDHMRRQRAGAD